MWSIEGDASGMIGCGDVIGDVLVGRREVEIVCDWMRGYEMKAITTGSRRGRFG
jgi:hypothetical protein